MARKDASQSSSRGLNDVAGIALATAALLLMVALLSYDHGDSAVNIVPANNQPHNLGGPLGAWVALRLFWVFGIGAFMIPVLLLMYGLGYIFQFLAYLQRRWLWGAVLLLCCMGLASTFETDFRFLQHLQRGLNAPSVGGLIGQFLEQHGFRVTAAPDGKAMRRVMAQGSIDLVILDLMLPDENGLALCRDLRATSRVPVIFLTAAGSETDRVVGLEMGADDYLAKPFSTRELLARVRAVLRRTGPQAIEDVSPSRGSLLAFSGWTLDTGRRQLRSPDGVLVELSGGEYELLSALLNSPNIVLTRDQLLDVTRGRAAGPFDRTIDVQVGRLRRKIEADPKSPELIKTVRGGGYVLASTVERK